MAAYELLKPETIIPDNTGKLLEKYTAEVYKVFGDSLDVIKKNYLEQINKLTVAQKLRNTTFPLRPPRLIFLSGVPCAAKGSEKSLIETCSLRRGSPASLKALVKFDVEDSWALAVQEKAKKRAAIPAQTKNDFFKKFS